MSDMGTLGSNEGHPVSQDCERLRKGPSHLLPPSPYTATPPGWHTVGVFSDLVHPSAPGQSPAWNSPSRTPRTLRTPRQRLSIPLSLHWELSFGPHTGRGTSGDSKLPSQPVPTHLPLGLVEDAVHGVEQRHALIELEHLLLWQLQIEAERDVGPLGPDRTWARGLSMGGRGWGRQPLTWGSSLGLMIWPCRSMTR